MEPSPRSRRFAHIILFSFCSVLFLLYRVLGADFADIDSAELALFVSSVSFRFPVFVPIRVPVGAVFVAIAATCAIRFAAFTRLQLIGDVSVGWYLSFFCHAHYCSCSSFHVLSHACKSVMSILTTFPNRTTGKSSLRISSYIFVLPIFRSFAASSTVISSDAGCGTCGACSIMIVSLFLVDLFSFAYNRIRSYGLYERGL